MSPPLLHTIITSSPFKNTLIKCDNTKHNCKSEIHKPKGNQKVSIPITYDNFINGNINLNDYIIPKLKEVAKFHKIRSSG